MKTAPTDSLRRGCSVSGQALTGVLSAADLRWHFRSVFSNYIAYFRYLCEKHPDLLHAEQSGNRIFDVIALETAMGDFRTGIKAKDFAVRLVLPGGSAGGEVSNAFLSLTGGFVVMKSYSERKDGASKLDALNDSLLIAQDFLARMQHDSSLGVGPFAYGLNTLDAMQPGIQPRVAETSDFYAGWLVTFKFSQKITVCLGSPTAPAWTDGGTYAP